jgi:hypothetical protein
MHHNCNIQSLHLKENKLSTEGAAILKPQLYFPEIILPQIKFSESH